MFRCNFSIVIPFLLFIIQSVTSQSGQDYTLQEDCEDRNRSYLAVLPGRGWDNLRNVEQLNVLNISFSKCRKSLDGHFYIPNGVEIIPKLATNMETFSEVFEHFSSYRSLTSNSINVAAEGSYGGATMSGSFSLEYQTVKAQQINSHSITSRVQLRQHHFTVLSGQTMGLSKAFRDRLLDIGFQLHNNKSREAAYLADLVVADYGTNVITRVDAGGIIFKLDSLKVDSRNMLSDEKTKISASAAVGFRNMFNLSVSFEHGSEKSNASGYSHNLTSQKIGAFGGISIRPGIDISKWSDSIPEHLVAIDVDGDAIYSVINSVYLGETLPYKLIGGIQEAVKAAVKRYYDANKVVGCMSPESENFVPGANVKSDCETKKVNFTLGGFFQKCDGPDELCRKNEIPNTMTGKQSCPKGYREVLLQVRTFAYKRDWRWRYHWVPAYWVSRDVPATYFLYWCAAKEGSMPRENGFLFGGIYTKRAPNPFTNDKNCPPSFIPFSFGDNDIYVCLSRDFELSTTKSVDFGGFFSCNSGNPYTVVPNKSKDGKYQSNANLLRFNLYSAGPSNWPKSCPTGYSQHVGYIDNDCEMMFCSKENEVKQFQTQVVKRPPFIKLPCGQVPKPRMSHGLQLDVGAWKFDVKSSSWEFKEESRYRVVTGVLGSIIGTVFVAGFIAAVILIRRRKRLSSEYRPIIGATGHMNENDP